MFSVQNPFDADLVTGLYLAAENLGYELALSALTPRRDERTALAGLLQDRCEALILLSPTSPTVTLSGITARLPVVAMARPLRHRNLDVVRTDDVLGSRLAVEHLVGLGHRRIAHLDGGRRFAASDRRRGYQEAMRAYGLQDEIRIVPGGVGEEDGARAGHHIIVERPTAVTVYNDRSAAGVIDVVRRAGLSVPGDLSVVGYDDSPVASLAHIALSTIAQDTVSMAALGVARAIERIEGAPVGPREQIVAPHLIVRATTGPPRAGQLSSSPVQQPRTSEAIS